MVVGGGGRRPLEALGGHSGQFPRTDFGPLAGIDSSRTHEATLGSGMKPFEEQFVNNLYIVKRIFRIEYRPIRSLQSTL